MLSSHLIWGSAHKKSFLRSALFHFDFDFSLWGFLCSSQPLWLFYILVLECSPSCSRSLACSFSLALFSLPLPGWYKAVVWVLRSPWIVGSSESTLKGHFIMFMKQLLRPSSNMTYVKLVWTAWKVLLPPSQLYTNFFALWMSALAACLQSCSWNIFRSSRMYILFLVQGKGNVSHWMLVGNNYVQL